MKIVDKIKDLIKKEETVEVKEDKRKISSFKCCEMNHDKIYTRQCVCINMR